MLPGSMDSSTRTTVIAGAGDAQDCCIGKLENLSSLIVAVLMGLVFIAITVNAVRGLVLHFHRYDRLYGVRSRRAGNRVFIDIHVGFDASRRVGDVEQDIAAMRAGVMRHFKNA